jgi:RimJ/RimL family protein N-acetyltransferase
MMFPSFVSGNMMKIANTQRLQFEMMTQDDGQFLFELDQDPVVMRFINGGRASTMEEIDTVLLPRLKSYANPDKGWGIWKVTTLETELDFPSTYIGFILVRPMDFFCDAPKFNDIELGWRFKQMSWGKGYATEAAKAFLEMLAQQADVNYVSAVADEDNVASIGIMKKLGMQFIERTDHSTPNGMLEVVHYQIDV